MKNKNLLLILGALGIIAIPLVMAKPPPPPKEWVWDQARWGENEWA